MPRLAIARDSSLEPIVGATFAVAVVIEDSPFGLIISTDEEIGGFIAEGLVLG
jgi:hypothetical protein